MTNATTNINIRPPFGVGTIVGDSFRLFFSRFSVFFLLAFVPTLAIDLLLWLIIGREAILLADNPVMLERFLSAPELVLFYVLPFVGYSFATALMVLAAYDARIGHHARVGAYFAVAITRTVPVLLVSIVVYILIALGLILLIIPGLYVAAMLSATITVVVVERMGLGAIGRSADLTRDYRWPILGTIIVLFLCVLVLGFVLGFVVGLIQSLVGVSLLSSLILFAAASAIPNGILAIGYVLIYARLREIKEGTTVQSLVEVFS